MTCAKGERCTGRADALRDHVHIAKDLGKLAPFPQLHADVAIAAQIARTSDDEITKAAQARQRVATGALRAGETCNLREAARDERRHRVVAEADPFDNPGGNGNDVLQRSADFDAGYVVAGIEAQTRAAKLFLY